METIGKPSNKLFPIYMRCGPKRHGLKNDEFHNTGHCGVTLKIEASDICTVDNVYGVRCPVCGMFNFIDPRELGEETKAQAKEVRLTHLSLEPEPLTEEEALEDRNPWVRKECGTTPWNPYYYECRNGNLKITLTPPYKSGPWTTRMSHTRKDGTTSTIHKDAFRFNDGSAFDDDESHWETIDDLEDAKAQAFEIAFEHILPSLNYWDSLYTKLERLKLIAMRDVRTDV